MYKYFLCLVFTILPFSAAAVPDGTVLGEPRIVEQNKDFSVEETLVVSGPCYTIEDLVEYAKDKKLFLYSKYQNPRNPMEIVYFLSNQEETKGEVWVQDIRNMQVLCIKASVRKLEGKSL